MAFEQILAQWENAGGRTTVSVELLADGSLQVFYYDIGADAQRIFGDSDYEAWLTVPPDQLGKLAIALIAAQYTGRPDALSALRTFCAAEGVAHESGSWT